MGILPLTAYLASMACGLTSEMLNWGAGVARKRMPCLRANAMRALLTATAGDLNALIIFCGSSKTAAMGMLIYVCYTFSVAWQQGYICRLMSVQVKTKPNVWGKSLKTFDFITEKGGVQ